MPQIIIYAQCLFWTIESIPLYFIYLKKAPPFWDFILHPLWWTSSIAAVRRIRFAINMLLYNNNIILYFIVYYYSTYNFIRTIWLIPFFNLGVKLGEDFLWIFIIFPKCEIRYIRDRSVISDEGMLLFGLISWLYCGIHLTKNFACVATTCTRHVYGRKHFEITYLYKGPYENSSPRWCCIKWTDVLDFLSSKSTHDAYIRFLGRCSLND